MSLFIDIDSPEANDFYVPAIADSLEQNIDNWFDILPEVLRFDRDFDVIETPDGPQAPALMDHDIAMIRMDYFGISLVIHWPLIHSLSASKATELDVATTARVQKAILYLRRFIAVFTPLLKFTHPNLWTVCNAYPFRVRC